MLFKEVKLLRKVLSLITDDLHQSNDFKKSKIIGKSETSETERITLTTRSERNVQKVASDTEEDS